jgi:hypothetical protein
VDALVGRGKQIFEAQFARCVAKTAGIGQGQQLDAGVVDQLEQIFAVEGKQRRVHHLKDARQQRGGLKRTHALLLQQIGERVHLGCQFAERVRGAGSAGAEGVVALAQRRDDIGERLQGADHGFNQRGGYQEQIKQQAAEEQDRGREGDSLLVDEKAAKTSAGNASSRQ